MSTIVALPPINMYYSVFTDIGKAAARAAEDRANRMMPIVLKMARSEYGIAMPEIRLSFERDDAEFASKVIWHLLAENLLALSVDRKLYTTKLGIEALRVSA